MRHYMTCDNMLRNIPEDINVEELLPYIPEGTFRISVEGLHKRNSYKDILGCTLEYDGKMELHVGRRSLYNSLPEYMFHPMNRYDNLPENERKERLKEEYSRQEAEKENAHRFFAPIDIMLLDLKAKVRAKVSEYAAGNVVMQDIIGDSLTAKERGNRFIKRTIPFLPNCKRIRGNRTLITLLLRKILFEEGLLLKKEELLCDKVDGTPRYDCDVDGSAIGSMYLGNEFSERVTTYTVQYWSDKECTGEFNVFLEELEEFRLFVQDYFMSIEDELYFRIVADYPGLRLADEQVYNYLNYNTNL